MSLDNVLTDAGTLPCDLVISTTDASIKEGVILEGQLGKLIFPTTYQTTVDMRMQVLVNGEMFRIVGPVELQNAIQPLQVCECAVERIVTK